MRIQDKLKMTQCRRNLFVVKVSSGSRWTAEHGLLDSIDGGSTDLRNVGNHSPNSTVSHARTHESFCEVHFFFYLEFLKANTLKIFTANLHITQSAILQVNSLFRSQFSPECNLMLPLSISSNFSFSLWPYSSCLSLLPCLSVTYILFLYFRQ